MNNFATSVARFLCGDEGVTAIEYALIAALIAVVIIGGATSIGLNANAVFNSVAGAIANA